MKHACINLGISILLLFTTEASSQRLDIIKVNRVSEKHDITPAKVSYDSAYLSRISDSMFSEGNPKYIWVELLRDGYIQDGDISWHNIYIDIDGKEPAGNVVIPTETSQAYVKRWLQFVQSLHEPLDKYGKYYLSNMSPINASEMVNPESAFRKITKAELNTLRLTTRGELRFINELVKDGLASPNLPLNLDFSKDGFFIYGIRLTKEQREKYMNICQEEFGNNYYNDGSSFKRGPLPENTLNKEIAELTARIDAVTPTPAK